MVFSKIVIVDLLKICSWVNSMILHEVMLSTFRTDKYCKYQESSETSGKHFLILDVLTFQMRCMVSKYFTVTNKVCLPSDRQLCNIGHD